MLILSLSVFVFFRIPIYPQTEVHATLINMFKNISAQHLPLLQKYPSRLKTEELNGLFGKVSSDYKKF